MNRVLKVLAAPILWQRACNEHSRLCKAHRKAIEAYNANPSRDLFDVTQRTYAKTGPACNAVFENVISAYLMILVYGAIILVLVLMAVSL